MERIRHELRLSETVSPFGVGAIVDIRGESLIAADTSWWDKKSADEISCPRLVERLGGGVLRQAPAHGDRAGKDAPSLLYWRFPAWRFCERCGALSMVTGRDKGRWRNRCECGGVLVPMRYTAVCTQGSHVQDIPWFKWAHRGHDDRVTERVRFCRAYTELRFERSTKRGEGLGSLRVVCGGCGRSRPLSELVLPDALNRDGIKCDGRQPWQDTRDAVVCDHRLVAVQRGATGNYIAERLSALDIPEERPPSEEVAARVRAHDFYNKVVDDNGGPQAQLVATWIAADVGTTPEEVLRIAAETSEEATPPLLSLKDGEWAAFLKKLDQGRDRSDGDFVVDGWRVHQSPSVPSSLTERLEAVGQVRRVREVRALKGFRRHHPGADFVRADLSTGHKPPVYPAVEMFGEGIFLRFSEEAIAAWEALPEVKHRAAILSERRAANTWAERLDEPEPRFVALHTLAHLLIRRLAFESGYASAALQERVYANSTRRDKTAGLLIYTAAGDAQGTLGGLVRLGKPDKLFPLILSALDDADVCSNDPVCIESDRQGSSQLNLSACHGCCLISETSCETSNRLLDRQLLLGGSSAPGFLEEVLQEVRQLGAVPR